MLEKRKRIIGNLKSKYWVRTHKFSVRIPKPVQEAKAFYEDNVNTLWWDDILKGIKKSGLILSFGIKTYQSCLQDIKILHVI